MHLYICALQLLFSFFFSNHFNQFSVVYYSTAPRPCIYSSTENSSAAAEKNSSAASLSLYHRLVFAMLTAYLPVKLRRDPTPPLLQRSSKLKRRRTLQTFSEFPYSNALRWLLLHSATLTRSVAVALPPSLWPSGTQSPMSNRGTAHAPKKTTTHRLTAVLFDSSPEAAATFISGSYMKGSDSHHWRADTSRFILRDLATLVVDISHAKRRS